MIKRKPILWSLFILVSIVVLNRIPLDNYIHSLCVFESSNVEYIQQVAFNTVAIVFVLVLIIKNKVPISFSANIKLKTYLYYLPIVFYLFAMSGTYSALVSLEISNITNVRFGLFTAKVITSAFLEEVLFRGLILGLFLDKYKETQVFKSIFLSGILFGIAHLLNVWTMSDMSVQGVINQVYVASGLGVLFGAVYMKTKSILLLFVIHFAYNFGVSIDNLLSVEIVQSADLVESSLYIIILEEFITLIIYGIPLMLGVVITKQINKDDINSLGIYA